MSLEGDRFSAGGLYGTDADAYYPFAADDASGGSGYEGLVGESGRLLNDGAFRSINSPGLGVGEHDQDVQITDYRKDYGKMGYSPDNLGLNPTSSQTFGFTSSSDSDSDEQETQAVENLLKATKIGLPQCLPNADKRCGDNVDSRYSEQIVENVRGGGNQPSGDKRVIRSNGVPNHLYHVNRVQPNANHVCEQGFEFSLPRTPDQRGNLL
jgi:hypothetical protein